MNITEFNAKKKSILAKQEELHSKSNQVLDKFENGIYDRFVDPVLTDAHVPLDWKYDFNYDTNPNLLQRLGINVVLNTGAIEFNGKHAQQTAAPATPLTNFLRVILSLLSKLIFAFSF